MTVGPFRVIGDSAAFRQTLATVRRIARSDAPVLIEGETGSGKEVAARLVHYGGPRAAEPFVPINCGALPDELFESELFGHERGAFTDARERRRGLVAEADGGTLFLDEVDALAPKSQVALLRFLQDQCFRPLGSSREQQG
ncbi:MAG: sigma-54 factor interaction domain-containing protein, partial [Rubrivivax sp.]|nr:sigma-54 factor interaction domain-containing protein [Rubrivivax sp.]